MKPVEIHPRSAAFGRPWRFLLAAWIAFASWVGRSQPAPDLLVTAGTTTLAPDGKPLGYVAWSSGSPRLTAGRVFAVYTKPGAPDSAVAFARREIVLPAADEARAAARLTEASRLLPGAPDAGSLLGLIAKDAGVSSDGSTAAFLARLIAASGSNPVLLGRLELLGANQPAVALALARAWAGELVAGLNTVELREWDPASQSDLRVVGRVILDTANPGAMPAPGAPVQVPDLTANGDLAIGLRWAEPPDLRRRSPFQTGFNLWRMPLAEAESRGLLARAPTGTELRALAQRVNELPIATPRVLSTAEAGNVGADPLTRFFVDDNGRREPGGQAFADGARFAYFATALDLLGRDGTPSPAGLATACGTLAPPVPTRVEVANLLHAVGASKLAPTLQVSWTPVSNAPPANADYYEVFRGTNGADWRPLDPPPAAWQGRIEHAGGTRLAWVDTALAAAPSAAGHTFWYALRSVRLSPCGPIVSPLSPPIQATFRDFTPPAAPEGHIDENCPRVSVLYDHSFQAPLPTGAPPALLDTDGTPLRRHRVEVRRRDRGIAWTQVIATDALGFVHQSEVTWFEPDEEVLAFDFNRRLLAASGVFLNVECRVGSEEGRTHAAFHAERRGEEIVVTQFLAGSLSLDDLSPEDPLSQPWLASTAAGAVECLGVETSGIPGPEGQRILRGNLNPGTTYLVQDRSGGSIRVVGAFTAEPLAGNPAIGFLSIRDPEATAPTYCVSAVVPDLDGSQQPRPCKHEAFPPGSGRIVGPRLQADFDVRTREFRLYRRVDDGPLTLIAQGPLPPDPTNPAGNRRVILRDTVMPEAGGSICYFAQAVDANGNGSPMTPLGCVQVPPRELPAPVLARPEAVGDALHPQLKLTWMCPPAGVGRFEVFLQAERATNSPVGNRTNLSVYQAAAGPPQAVHRVRDPFGQIVQASIPADRMLTDSVGSAALGDGPKFTLTLDVETGARYTLFIKAVSPGPLFLARRSAASFSYRFTWHSPTQTAPGIVPWPQRPLPPVTRFHPDIVAMQVPAFARLWPTNAEEAPVAVRIGRLGTLGRDVTDRSKPGPADRYILATVPKSIALDAMDPNRGVFREQIGPSPRTNAVVLPVVLYRQQITNAAYPRVSGDVSQVSPLVSEISWEVDLLLQDLWSASLVDPFFLVTRHLLKGDVTGGPPDLWLLDTHPVVAGARYRYWLMRFSKNGEPDAILPAGEVEIQ